MNGQLLDLTISRLLVRAKRYRTLAAATWHDADTARELEHIAALFEAHASRGYGAPVRLH
jgi:hypothetical protein